MNIFVKRVVSNPDVTISRVYVDGRFFCHGLEDEYRARKVPGETRIPAGSYGLGLRREGGFHQRYSTLFGARHQGMIEIRDVPNFKHILIHIGNYDRDTAGCLLLGKAEYSAWAVWQSKTTYVRFYQHVIDAVKAGDARITFEDHDR
ncbi:MAG: hypothetical protein HKN36_08210 [Hellea sp.]|nr:hypothetical protein [Hellea sp.]